MTRVTVSPQRDGDFETIGAALAAFAPDEPLELLLHSGVYREKLFCDRAYTGIVGAGKDSTIITWGDGAFHTAADGRPNGTFRSYTLWLGGGYAKLEGVTVTNSCGDGRTAGQGIALAVDAAMAEVSGVRLLGCQDTLYTGPLPERERQPNGFLGPRQHSPRIPSRQLYSDCEITGDIDFIFGGADALFERCVIICRDRGERVNGYIAAPSTPPGGLGYLFHQCTVCGDAAASFYLARPWREYGRAVFGHCSLGEVVIPEGWDDWNDKANRQSCFFAECLNSGKGALDNRAFGQQLDAVQYDRLYMQYQEIFKKTKEKFVPVS